SLDPRLTSTVVTSTPALHDALPISNIFDAMATDNMLQIIAFAIFIGIAMISVKDKIGAVVKLFEQANEIVMWIVMAIMKYFAARSEEHTSELQSRFELVCCLLLEKR